MGAGTARGGHQGRVVAEGILVHLGHGVEEDAMLLEDCAMLAVEEAGWGLVVEMEDHQEYPKV